MNEIKENNKKSIFPRHSLTVEKEKKMASLSLEGVAVDFPYEPYQCQVEYMRSVIRAINGASNALLESPTGTGKVSQSIISM